CHHSNWLFMNKKTLVALCSRYNLTVNSFTFLCIPSHKSIGVIDFTTRFRKWLPLLLCHRSCQVFCLFLNQIIPVANQFTSLISRQTRPLLKCCISSINS